MGGMVIPEERLAANATVDGGNIVPLYVPYSPGGRVVWRSFLVPISTISRIELFWAFAAPCFPYCLAFLSAQLEQVQGGPQKSAQGSISFEDRPCLLQGTSDLLP